MVPERSYQLFRRSASQVTKPILKNKRDEYQQKQLNTNLKFC